MTTQLLLTSACRLLYSSSTSLESVHLRVHSLSSLFSSDAGRRRRRQSGSAVCERARVRSFALEAKLSGAQWSVVNSSSAFGQPSDQEAISAAALFFIYPSTTDWLHPTEQVSCLNMTCSACFCYCVSVCDQYFPDSESIWIPL